MKVQPYKTRLCKENAYWMIRIASEVYQKTDENDAPDELGILNNLKAEDAGFISVLGESKNSAQGALIEHKDYLCLAFRGTDEIDDWLDNFNVFSEAAMFGDFHKGFLYSLEDIWTPLFKQIKKLKSEKSRPVFITGHSLGGAMATVAAAKMIHADLPFTSVYTFGQPRVVTADTARIINIEAKNRYFRFQNNNDIVTRVPARLMGYSHVGQLLYITKEKEIHNDPGFWYQFLDSVTGAVQAAVEQGLDLIEDHARERYREAIEKWDSHFDS